MLRYLTPRSLRQLLSPLPAPHGVLGVDVGSKKSGVAWMEVDGEGRVLGMKVLRSVRGGRGVEGMGEVVGERAKRMGVKGVVVGVPLGQNGEETEGVERSVVFLQGLEKSGWEGVGVVLVDEYGSSVRARGRLMAGRERGGEGVWDAMDGQVAKGLLEEVVRGWGGVGEGVEGVGGGGGVRGGERKVGGGIGGVLKRKKREEGGSERRRRRKEEGGKGVEERVGRGGKGRGRKEKLLEMMKKAGVEETKEALQEVLEKGVRRGDHGWEEALFQIDVTKVVDVPTSQEGRRREGERKKEGFVVSDDGVVDGRG